MLCTQLLDTLIAALTDGRRLSDVYNIGAEFIREKIPELADKIPQSFGHSVIK